MGGSGSSHPLQRGWPVTRRLIVRKKAELELNKAVIWYEEQRAGLGLELLAEMRTTVGLIRKRPESFPIDYRHAGRALLVRFPYAVHFTVTDTLISVIAVLHTRQDKRKQLRNRL